jgi:Protein of unknown function (DUF3768)
MEMAMDRNSQEWREQVRRLNDRFRTKGIGTGSLVITGGVRDTGVAFVAAALSAVREFSAFGRDNDPYGEHDFGAFDIDGRRLFFKFDYYDRTMQGHSPDAADPEQTHRVLTVMLANEY